MLNRFLASNLAEGQAEAGAEASSEATDGDVRRDRQFPSETSMSTPISESENCGLCKDPLILHEACELSVSHPFPSSANPLLN